MEDNHLPYQLGFTFEWMLFSLPVPLSTTKVVFYQIKDAKCITSQFNQAASILECTFQMYSVAGLNLLVWLIASINWYCSTVIHHQYKVNGNIDHFVCCVCRVHTLANWALHWVKKLHLCEMIVGDNYTVRFQSSILAEFTFHFHCGWKRWLFKAAFEGPDIIASYVAPSCYVGP